MRLNDIKNHRKDIAIRKSGEELILIHWDKLPKTTIQLETVNNVTDNIRETKRTITHTISEIQKGYSVNYTYTLINFVEAITTEYNLYNHTITKISDAINNNPSGKEELTYLKERLTDLSMKEIESENI